MGSLCREPCTLSSQAMVFSVVVTLFAVHPNYATAAKVINSFAGPYRAYAVSITMCDLSEFDSTITPLYVRMSHYNPAKPSSLQTITGNITWPLDFTDDDWMHATVATRSNNQWKQNAFVLPFKRGACSSSRTQLPALYRALYKMDPASTKPCVVKAGVYTVDHEPIDWSLPLIQVFPYGHWLVKIKIGRESRTLPYFCVLSEAKTVPKV